MEILNNHQPAKRNRKVIFQDRLKDYSLGDQMENPLRFDSYSVSGSDLILTRGKCEGGEFDRMNSFRDWKLINVDKKDCNTVKLERLVNDPDIQEIKIVETPKGKKIIFYSNGKVYGFKCEIIYREIKGYGREEMVRMIRENEKYLDYIETQNSKLYEFVVRLSRFINGESRDQRNLLALNQGSDISLATKSAHYLEMLSLVKDKLEDLKKILPEESLRYYGIKK